MGPREPTTSGGAGALRLALERAPRASGRGFDRRAGLERDSDREASSHPGLALELDRAAMRRDDAGGDREAEAQAGRVELERARRVMVQRVTHQRGALEHVTLFLER